MSRWLGVVSVVVFGFVSCGHTLDSGSYGDFRFIGRVKGQPPLTVFPPVSDRTGNVYILYGSIGVPETKAFVTRAAGGSAEACALTKGDVFGAHGWVGFSDDRAWYWSGYALVQVPVAAPCAAVLNVDPQTDANLQFRAVMPWVRVTSTRSTLVALIQSPTDPFPFSALVDLDRGIATNVAEIGGVTGVLGVGAEPQGDRRVVLVRKQNDMAALFFDEEANLVRNAPVRGAPPPEYGVVGALQFGKSGVVVGLTTLGSLVIFDGSGGGTFPVDPSLAPIGVHRWNDALFLVGTVQNRPVVCALDDSGHPGPPIPWSTSETAALMGPLTVTDDRTFPARSVSWPTAKTAIGAWPFLSAQSPWPHAPSTTLWVAAGPTDDASGRPVTSIAIAPVGLSYP